MSAAHPITRLMPSGNLLAPEVFASRHRLLVQILLGHVPVLYVFALLRGYDPLWSALEISPALLAAGMATLGEFKPTRVRAVLVTAGLSWTSIVLVHVTGGQIESHFHFFIVLGFIALYQDWLPFTWYIGFTALSHGLGSLVAPSLVFEHAAGQAEPWLWSGVHAGGVAMLSVGLIIFWSNTEAEQKRATALATELSDRDLERARADIQQRQAQSQMLLNLARRNQSLVQRQLDTIEVLESDEQRPHVLEQLFSLDHMSTRMRRNAESLLVLSGAEPARIWRQPVPLSDVLRAAISEVEDYQRIDLVLGEDPRLEGRAAADLSHLFAELVENATTFSSPTTRARVSAQMSPTGELVVVVRDYGVGMDAATLRGAKALLGAGIGAGTVGDGPAMTPGDARLGLQVVGLLARRYGLDVEIGAGSTGTTVEVVLPAALVAAEEPPAQSDFEPALQHRSRHSVPAQTQGPGSHDGYDGTPVQVSTRPAQPAPVDLWNPALDPGPEAPAVAARPVAVPSVSAFAAFSSRQPATSPSRQPAAAPPPVAAPGSATAPVIDPANPLGLPDLPRRTHDDEVNPQAPVDLWATPIEGGQW